MSYKLIATDMDGTLLNSQNKITDRNKKAILEALEAGVKVILCTGRIFTSALYYAKTLKLDTPIIACNGAYIAEQDKSKIIYEEPISIESFKKIVEIAEEENMYYHFYDDSTFYARELNDTIMNYMNWNKERDEMDRIDIRIVKNPLDTIKDENRKVYKIVFVDENREKLKRFREKISTIKGIEVASSWWSNVEVMNEGVSKGKALNKLCDMLNISMDEVIAIGDNENDIPMLKVAGLGIAMANGEGVAKDAADYIADTNDESGVGKIIEKFILKKDK
ncbi:MAG: HAD family phosphatase [Sporanaerobacter sp.]|jgi:Cof subfamily protein (haloacid dehalogenase superfamily)|uniref:Cof-type HAD-IIB family hydrolase n=1 Tax=Sporanaerobacter sp. TaxID=2010183 RepID=UPI003A0FC516